MFPAVVPAHSPVRYQLSISIFRRLSLFLELSAARAPPQAILSISIFRRLSLFRMLDIYFLSKEDYFQSPFSGDFLCFSYWCEVCCFAKIIFQSPFSGDFLCFFMLSCDTAYATSLLSISIFRRLSLFLVCSTYTKIR